LTSIERRLSRVERQFAALFKRVNRSKNGSSDDEVTSDHDQDSNNKNNYKQSKKNKRKSQGVDNSCNSGGNQWLLLPQYYWY
jgi:hypothetical protein